jgi:AraC-like DNA-binding protein
VSLSIDNRERKFSPDDYDLMMFAVCNIIDETIPGANHLPPIYHDQMVHLLFGSSDEANVPFNIHLYNAMDALRGNIETYLKLGVHIGISREYRDWSYAARALQESEHALYYRDRLDDASILFIKEVEPGEARGFRYPKELEFQLEQAIRRCDAVQAEAALRDLVRSVYARALHRSDSQHALDRLFNQLSGLIQEKNESITSVLEFYRIPEKFFDRPHSPDAIEHWLMQHLVRPLIRWSEEQSEKSDIAISACIIQEIEKHYDQDLTIEWFAQRLNYHPSYISRVFRKDTGMTFSEYLSNYRIEKAKQMLAHSNMKIADIAEKLRYSTPSNFNRHFKKVVQLTPSQYREQTGGGA